MVDDRDNSVVAFLRKSEKETLLCAFNFTPVYRPGYSLPVPEEGTFSLAFSTGELPAEQGWSLTTEPSYPGARFPHMVRQDLFPFCGMYFKFTQKNDGKDVTQG